MFPSENDFVPRFYVFKSLKNMSMLYSFALYYNFM